MKLSRYIHLEIRRMFKNRNALFFSVFLPVLLYFVFGSTQTGTDQTLGDGNVAAYVMIGMAVYGGITGAVGTVGNIVVDETSGWGRQLSLTPIKPWHRLVTHIITTCLRISLPVAAVFISGYFSGAIMPTNEWVLTALLSVLACIPFSLYGLAFGTAFRSQSATSAATGFVIPLSFLGNAFSPLSENILEIGRFSPVYGTVSLARYPLTDGLQAISSAPFIVTDPLWYAAANVIAWTLIFAGINILLWQRDNGRLA